MCAVRPEGNRKCLSDFSLMGTCRHSRKIDSAASAVDNMASAYNGLILGFELKKQ